MPKAEASSKDEAGATVDIKDFQTKVKKDDGPNDMDMGQSLAQAKTKTKSKTHQKKGSHIKHIAKRSSAQKKQVLSQQGTKDDFDATFEEEEHTRELHEAAERAKRQHAAQLKKEQADIEKSIQVDGLVHKDGKRFEPYTGKEIEDSLVKTHTKKEHKKHETQSMA